MLQSASTPLSAMDPATMRAVFNYLAAERGKPGAPADADRFELGKGIALLRATPKPKVATPAKAVAVSKAKAPPRLPVIREYALAQMARVVAYRNVTTGKEVSADFFEAGNEDGDDWQSSGLSYFDIVKAVRKKFPKSRISANVLRQFTHGIKTASALEADGAPVPPTLEHFRSIVIPERRPKSSTGVSHGKQTTRDNGSARANEGQRKRAAKHGAKRRAR